MMSHDWPNGVVEYGNKSNLLRKKQHFAGIYIFSLTVLLYNIMHEFKFG